MRMFRNEPKHERDDRISTTSHQISVFIWFLINNIPKQINIRADQSAQL